MKYHNASKAKLNTWYRVWGPKHQDVKKARDWCFAQPSRGKFFNRYYQTYWWFEDEKDACMFAMLWSCDPDKQKPSAKELNITITKTVVNSTPRKLKAQWTLETDKHIGSLHGL